MDEATFYKLTGNYLEIPKHLGTDICPEKPYHYFKKGLNFYYLNLIGLWIDCLIVSIDTAYELFVNIVDADGTKLGCLKRVYDIGEDVKTLHFNLDSSTQDVLKLRLKTKVAMDTLELSGCFKETKIDIEGWTHAPILPPSIENLRVKPINNADALNISLQGLQVRNLYINSAQTVHVGVSDIDTVGIIHITKDCKFVYIDYLDVEFENYQGLIEVKEDGTIIQDTFSSKDIKVVRGMI